MNFISKLEEILKRKIKEQKRRRKMDINLFLIWIEKGI